MKTPIVLIIYHRPEMTKGVIDCLRMVKPTRLFVVADGPRSKRDGILCQKTRQIINLIDWKCNIQKIYSSKNLGLRNRVSTGLDKVFNEVDKAIILEDDLIIDPSFFTFCEEMLDKYKDDDRIISIAGDNFLFGNHNIKESYYFSRYVYSWGWATWRRAWKLYDDEMKKWPNIRQKGILKDFIKEIGPNLYWSKIFDLTYSRLIDSWAYCWTFASITNNKLTIVPTVNMVSNVGFGQNATHTAVKSRVLNMRTESIRFPLSHPNAVKRDKTADRIVESTLYMTPRIVVGLMIRSLFKWIKN